MIRNYLKVLWRNLMRQPIYFGINLVGLTTGLTACLLICFYISYELSYDRFHPKLDRIYRVNYDMLMGEQRTISPSVPAFVAPHMKQLFPEIEMATRFTRAFSPVAMGAGEKLFEESTMAWADANFFDVFNFPLERGSLTTFSKPNTLILTKAMAEKYFGDEDPIGKTLTLYGDQVYEIVAIAQPVPANSYLRFDFLGSFASLQLNDASIQWNNPNYDTYLLLNPGSDVGSLQEKVNNWVTPVEERKQANNQLYLPLEPMAGVHFNTTVFNYQGMNPIVDLRYVYTFGAIAVLLLLIAAVNYVNLATARSIQRSKEVGIRKSSGAGYGQLVIQFLGESFIQVFFALSAAVGIAVLLRPALDNLLGTRIAAMPVTTNFLMLAAVGGLALSVAAGLYPALVLSRFRPVDVLKGKSSSGGGAQLRKSLVVVQFVASTILVIGTVVVYSQLSFMQNKKLGLTKDQVIFIRGNKELAARLPAFLTTLRELPGVESVAASWRSPFQTVVGNGMNLNPTGEGEWVGVGAIAGDENYLATLGLELVKGRNFQPSAAANKVNEFIVNEAFLHEFGVKPEDAVGKEVVLGLVSEQGPGTIVGIVKDFHFASLHEPVKPAMIFNSKEWQYGALVRFNGSHVQELLTAMEQSWKQFVANRPFNYTFLDQQYETMYRTEQRVSQLTGIFALIAISVACLGLLGLAAFTSVQRAKEITIRKVLGATSFGVMRMLTGSYLRLIGIAFVFSVPLSYWLMNRWLAGFAYRIEVGWWHYAGSLLILGVLAYLTVGYQSLRAASVNPAEGLRSE